MTYKINNYISSWIDFLPLQLFSTILNNGVFIILCFIIVSSILLNSYASKKADIIKNIGRIGTGVLAGVGAIDSSLSLYDRYKDSSGG
jgi:hypothetical protein